MTKQLIIILLLIFNCAFSQAQEKWITSAQLDLVFPNNNSYSYVNSQNHYFSNDTNYDGFLLRSLALQADYNYLLFKKLSLGVLGGLQTQTKPSYSFLKLGGVFVSLPPDTLQNDAAKPSEELTQFMPKPITLDDTKGTFFTFMEYNKTKNKLVIGDLSGSISAYDFNTKEVVPMGGFGSGITSIIEKDSISFITTIGILNPSDIVNGRLFRPQGGEIRPVINDVLHWSVHTLIQDLDKTGTDGIVVSEFGNLRGKRSLLVKDE